MNNNHLLHKARQLIQMGLIAAVPVTAMADEMDRTSPPPPVSTAQLQSDFSAVGTYSNSGFFTGDALDESKATGSTYGMGFKLSGESLFTDSQLYGRRYQGCWDGVCDASQLYYSRGDTTGTAFIWGGKVNGNLVDGDRLKAAYEFSIDWTHTALPVGYDAGSVNWSLSMGFSNMEYADAITPQLVRSNSRSSSQNSGSIYYSGLSTITGDITADYRDNGGEHPDWYWYVLLEAHLNESGPRYTSPGDPAPASINGDFLKVTVPQHSIDIGVNAVPVPEPESWALGVAGLSVAALMARRRRRAAA